MKKRQGFVSNSSVSSFVILGFKLNMNDFEEERREELFNTPSGIMLVHRTKDIYVYGIEIADTGSDGSYLDEDEFDYAELEDKLKKGCEASGIEMPVGIKIFTGTREA